MGALSNTHTGRAAPDDKPTGWDVVERLLDSMDEEDRALCLSWLHAPAPVGRRAAVGAEVGTSTIAESLRSAGFKTSEGPLNRYRRWLHQQAATNG